MCGGGSIADAEVVSAERGRAEAGVEVRRSEYDMNDSRFCAGEMTGDGGCEVDVGKEIGGEEAKVGVLRTCSPAVVAGESPFPSEEVAE